MGNDQQPLFDMSVEPLVRTAIAAGIARNIDSSMATLRAMGSKAQQCVYLGSLICAHLLNQLDSEPSESDVQEWATDFTDMEDWAAFDKNEVVLYLKALSNVPREGSASPETVLRLTFVLAGWLLTAFQWDSDTHWSKLDEVIHLIQIQEEAQS